MIEEAVKEESENGDDSKKREPTAHSDNKQQVSIKNLSNTPKFQFKKQPFPITPGMDTSTSRGNNSRLSGDYALAKSRLKQTF
jgi:hypothetical protein